MAIPKLRSGSYFPEWLLQRRRRAVAALVTVVATSYLLGVSTRRMERLVASLGIDRLSKSQVSEMEGPGRAGRRVPVPAAGRRPVHVRRRRRAGAQGSRGWPHGERARATATGVNADGYREILGLQVSSAEDGAGWLAFLREQHDEWTEMRRYLGLEVLAKSRTALISTENTNTNQEDLTPAALTA